MLNCICQQTGRPNTGEYMHDVYRTHIEQSGKLIFT